MLARLAGTEDEGKGALVSAKVGREFDYCGRAGAGGGAGQGKSNDCKSHIPLAKARNRTLLFSGSDN
jgi:hypothetical protein